MKHIIKKAVVVVALVLALCTLAAISVVMAADTSPEPILMVEGMNLSFCDSTYLKYAVSTENLPDGATVEMLVWRDAKSDPEGYVKGSGETVLSSDGTATVAGKECLVFVYDDIAVKEMTDNIYAKAYVKVGNDEYYSEMKKYSVLQYAYNKLGYTGTATTDPEFEALVKGTLKYGASAQKYLKYNTDRMVGDPNIQEYVNISVSGGYLSDGCTYGIEKIGSEVELVPYQTPSTGVFSHWIDSEGNVVNGNIVTVGASSNKYTAVYSSYSSNQTIAGAGDSLSGTSFALTNHTADPNAEPSSSVFTISSNYNGNGETIVAPYGVVIDGAGTVENVIIVGHITVKSANVTLRNVDIKASEYNAITVNTSAGGLVVDDCRITTNAAGVVTSAANTTVKNSYISAHTCVSSTADGTSVTGNRLFAFESGILSSGEDLAVNNNTISTSGIGIEIKNGSENTLVSYNVIEGSEKSVKIGKALNTSVLFNAVYDIVAESSTNTYIVKNALGGNLELTSNDYLICDINTYPADGEDHSPAMSENKNINGDSLMDVNERAEVGAKEELLPHTNKDLFINMNKKTTVKGTGLSLDAYIESNAQGGGVVIVPPGYYSMSDMISLSSAHSGAEIYAYGVFGEKIFDTVTNNNNRVLDFKDGIANVIVNGLTLGYDHPSSGQIHILQKLGNNRILAVPGAGFPESFKGGSNDLLNSDITPDIIIDGEHVSGSNITNVEEKTDGTLVITFGNIASNIYNAMGVGDIMYCRLKGANCHSINFGDIESAKLKDFTFYGYTAGMAFVSGDYTQGVELERVHNTSRSAAVIDQTTYDKYNDLQNLYGIEGLVSRDSSGNYRGSVPVVGSVDGMHVNRSSEGFTVTSSIFENMCDDGANHRGKSYRVYGYEISGDKVIFTIVRYYRQADYDAHKNAVNAVKAEDVAGRFSAGDTVYMYGADSKVIFKGEILSYTESGTITDYTIPATYKLETCEMTVNKAEVDLTSLDSYLFGRMDTERELIVDNLSRSSGVSIFDNVLFQNTRSYGMRIRNNNATVTNCTFRDIAMAAIMIGSEGRTWAEATMPENAQILNCLFENTGFRGYAYNTAHTPIVAEGFFDKTSGAAENAMIKGLVVDGCEFRNYSNMTYLIYLTGVKDSTITNNAFVNFTGTQAIYENMCSNVTKSGNSNTTGGTDQPEEPVGCVHSNLTGAAKTNSDGSITYTYTCGVCRETAYTRTVPKDINSDRSIIDDNTIKNLNMPGTLKYDPTEKIVYKSYVANDTFATAGGILYPTDGTNGITFDDPGRYLVIKYRTSGGMEPSLRINTHHWLAKSDTPTDWRVEVIDLSTSADYGYDIKTGTANKLYLRIFYGTTGAHKGYTFDLAYMALVDTPEEARMLLMEGETYYMSSISDAEELWSPGSECDSDGMCLDGKCVYAWASRTSGTNTVYEYKCSTCSTVIDARTVPNSVGKYCTPEKLTSMYNNGGQQPTRLSLLEDGVAYTRFTNTASNSSTALTLISKEAVKSGSYLVIKYRTSCSGEKTKMTLSVKSTAADGTTDSETYNTGNISYLNQPTEGFWLTGYINLAGTPVDGKITPDRLTTVTLTMVHDETELRYVVDIAFVAIVNNLDEAQALVSEGDKLTEGVTDTNWSVSDFNQDLAPLIKDKADNELQFIHFADVHRSLTPWNRVIEYYNEYSDYIDFAVHAGDYVGSYNSTDGGNYNDLYNMGTQSVGPVYNVAGNHDYYANAGGTIKLDKADVIDTLFNKTDNWNVNYMGGSAVNTSYYRDFHDQKVRFIVLDNYVDEESQAVWLKNLLDDANARGYHVLTSMHEPTAKIVDPINTSFHCNIEQTAAFRTSAFDKVIGDFIKDGGNFIANLTGHWHLDFAGYTENGVLNLSVEIASAGAVGSEQLDGRPQLQGDRGYDAFNVINVNTDDGVLEIVRIGNNSDSESREKTTLKYDYIKNVIIAENGEAK